LHRVFKTACSYLSFSLRQLRLLHTQGVFNNGNADIKEIAAHFESMFNIELGDYYSTYMEIRIRKTARTKFLNTLKNSLVKRKDEADEK